MRAAAPASNTDRYTCVRQDNLDLVLPGKDHFLRMVVPIQQESTARDMYVSAKSIRIAKLDAKLSITRFSDRKFRFELTGDEEYEHHSNVVGVDLVLHDVEVQTRSTAIDWVASLVSNRDKLKHKQHAKLFMKLSGVGEAKWNATAQDWDVELTKKVAKPFQFVMKDQYIIQEALTKYGGIDKLLMNHLWPVVRAAVPKSLAASFQHLSPSELSVRTGVQITGSMEEEDAPLKLKMTAATDFEAAPGRLLEVFLDKFDINDIVKTKVHEFLDDPKIQEKFLRNREAFVETLKHYGYVLGEDITKKVEAAESIQDLEPSLVAAAQGQADFILLALQPFMTYHAAGQRDFLEGVDSAMKADVYWKATEDSGAIHASLVPLKDDLLMKIPHALLMAVGLSNIILSPSSGQTVLTVNGLSMHESGLALSRTSLQKATVLVGNSTSNEVWQANGEFGDFGMSILASWVPPVQASMDELRISMDSYGDATVTGTGVTARYLEDSSPVNGTSLVRKGIYLKLDGPLPASYSRPTQPAEALTLTEMVPKAGLGMTVLAKGHGHMLNFEAFVIVEVDVDISRILPTVLAARPKQDYGYVFYSGRFTRVIHNGEKGAPGPTIESVAIISCGFLRVFKQEFDTEPLARIDMSPYNGQLEIDLTQYKTPLVAEASDDYGFCVDLYTAGLKARKTTWGWTVGERLCSFDRKDILKLLQALSLQIERFDDRRAKQWNYGTHPVDKPQYMLPGNAETESLLDIIEATANSATGLTEVDTAVEAPSLDSLPSAHELGLAEFAQVRGHEEPMLSSASAADDLDSGFEEADELMEGNATAPEKSADRKACLANDDLDMKIFPPEKFGESAIRQVIPSLPGIGDVHFVLGDIHVTGMDLTVEMGRKSDKVFSFEIGGRFDPKTLKKGQGHVHAWIEGLDFNLPHSPLDSIAYGWSKFENGVARAFTLGLGGKEYGRIDRGKIELRVLFQGDFEYNETAQKWKVVKGSTVQDVEVEFGSGGLLQAIINKAIEAYGGMDQLFFDSVWPLVQKAISPDLGKAFELVPKESGGIKYTVDLRANCFPEAEDDRCPSRTLAVNTTAKMSVFGDPKVVLTEYASRLEAAGKKPEGVLANVVQALKDDKEVFTGTEVKANVDVVLTADDEVTVDLDEEATVPADLFKSLAGSSTEMLMDFVPGGSALKVDGSFDFKRGVISMSGLTFQNVKLPVVLTEGETDALVIGGTVVSFDAKKIKSTGDPGSPDMLGENSPITISSAGVRIRLNRAGVEAGMVNGPGPELSIGKEYVHSMLEATTATWGTPMNVRRGVTTVADGPIPSHYQRPFSSMPTKPDFSKLLDGVEAKTEVTLIGQHPFKNFREVSLDIKTKTGLMLHMDQSFWKGILSTYASDFGYVHYSTPGFFGQSSKMEKAKPALALLHCATLEIFKVEERDDMYDSKFLEVDLSTNKVEKKIYDQYRCLEFTIKYSFCGQHSAVEALHYGILLQKQRLESVAELVEQHSDQKRAKLAKPDGTWFKDLQPRHASTTYPGLYPPHGTSDPTRTKEVVSPQQVWEAAYDSLNQ